MTYEQIAEVMEEMGLPFAYHHFAEGESPAPPFLLFLSPGENTFSADNQMYFSFKKLDIKCEIFFAELSDKVKVNTR